MEGRAVVGPGEVFHGGLFMGVSTWMLSAFGGSWRYPSMVSAVMMFTAGTSCCLPTLTAFSALQMEGMVTDLALAREKQPLFDKWKSEKRKQLPIDLTVTVLTTGFWPTYKVCPSQSLLTAVVA